MASYSALSRLISAEFVSSSSSENRFSRVSLPWPLAVASLSSTSQEGSAMGRWASASADCRSSAPASSAGRSYPSDLSRASEELMALSASDKSGMVMPFSWAS